MSGHHGGVWFVWFSGGKEALNVPEK